MNDYGKQLVHYSSHICDYCNREWKSFPPLKELSAICPECLKITRKLLGGG